MGFLRIYLFLTATVPGISGSEMSSLEDTAFLFPEQKRNKREIDQINGRRYSSPGERSVILGSPSRPYHLPAAEPILPGHTLIRPAIGMLKSAVKFPHREQENGSGVYGHFENIGIKFDGKNERVLYTGFRRSQPNGLPHPVTHPRTDQEGSSSILITNENSYEQDRAESRRYILTHRLSGLKDPNDVINRMLQKYRHVSNKKPSIEKPAKFTPLKYPRPYKNVLRTEEDYNVGKHGKYSFGKIIATETIEAKDIIDLFRIIQSVRRDDVHSVEDTPPRPSNKSEDLKYIPGKNSFGLAPDTFDSEEAEVSNKTVLFWNTKNLFNHVIYDPDAPDLGELLTADSSEKARNWWFYHQSDFEEFEE